MANKRISSLKDAFLCPKSLTSEARCSGEIDSFLIFGFPSLRLHASTRFITKALSQGFLIPSDGVSSSDHGKHL